MNNISSLCDNSPLFYNINQPPNIPSTYTILNTQIVDGVEYGVDDLLHLLNATLSQLLSMAHLQSQILLLPLCLLLLLRTSINRCPLTLIDPL